MKLFISAFLLNYTLVASFPEIELATRISDCIFIDNNREAIEIICDNFNETKREGGRCYSWLFKTESQTENQMNVKELKTRDCQSREYDESLSELFPNLISLDISFLGLEIPLTNHEFYFDDLQKFNASHNKFRKINSNMLFSTGNISDVDLSFNYIEIILSSTFQYSKTIRTIDISYNLIRYLESLSFDALKELRIVNLSSNLLEFFDMNLFEKNIKLEELYIENNRIKRVYVDVNYRAENVKVLSVAGNGIDFDSVYSLITKCFGSALRVLNVSSNNFTSSNFSMFHNLNHLQHVNLSNIHLSQFDFSAFKVLDDLQSLDLSSNYLNSLNFTEVKPFESLDYLNVENNDLSDLKVISVSNFPNLSKIGLKQNHLSCDYATKFLKEWPNLTAIDDQCDQKTEGGKINGFMVVGIIFGSAITIVCIVVAINRKSSRSNNFEHQTMPNFTYNKNNPIYEEPIYTEIDLSPRNYDRLEFEGQPTTLKNHYDNAILSNQKID